MSEFYEVRVRDWKRKGGDGSDCRKAVAVQMLKVGSAVEQKKMDVILTIRVETDTTRRP